MAPVMLAGILGTTAGHRSEAMPMFARKYNMPCAQCHTMVPRLTPMGYKFLQSGYRLKGFEEPAPNLANAVTFLADVHASSTTSDEAGAQDTRGFDTDGTEFAFASSIGEDLAAKLHYEFPSDETPSFSESWVQYNMPSEGPIYSARGGQIPVMAGIELGGARSITLTDPMMFGNVGPLTASGTGNFSLAGLERGVQFSATQNGITGKFSWLNGVDPTGNGQTSLQGKRANDVALQAEYMLGEAGSHVGAIYYNGKTPLDSYSNQFNRGLVYGSYAYPLKSGDSTLELSGAYLWGKDQIPAVVPELIAHASGVATVDAKSRGNLVEISLYQNGKTAFTARYDSVKPSDEAGNDGTIKATTFAATHLLNNNLRLTAEYRKQRSPNTSSFIASAWFFY
jgi:hypothetical protein